MRIILEDRHISRLFQPLTLTRHTADLRIGILTIKEKWEKITGLPIFFNADPARGDVVIPANIIPTKSTAGKIIEAFSSGKMPQNVITLKHCWHLLELNAAEIENDFDLLTGSRTSFPVSDTNKVSGKIFVEEGVEMEHTIINAASGPVYIGKNATVMEGSLIRGPFAMGEGSVIKMGGKMYPATTLGPFCIAGGEIKNSILIGYSNKAHDGYLGDSIIGEWCNLGAGTSNSNLKNTGGIISVQNDNELIQLGNKAGTIMGDYSRTAINTSLNTACVIGICCNIFGQGMVNRMPSFTWGNEKYELDKALRDIEQWKAFKKMKLDKKEVDLLTKIYQEQ